jgi:hypothetical protein
VQHRVGEVVEGRRSVEMPAPVRTTMRCVSFIQARTASSDE